MFVDSLFPFESFDLVLEEDDLFLETFKEGLIDAFGDGAELLLVKDDTPKHIKEDILYCTKLFKENVENLK